MSSIGLGYIHVYTGDGKGKTTASLGLALRAVGNGLKVLVIQFLKGSEMTGERQAALNLSPGLEIRPLGRNGLLHPGLIMERDRVQAEAALDEAIGEMTSGRWNVLILDELNTACSLGVVPEERVLQLMDQKPDGMELVLTGRGAPEKVIEKADLVTEMREIKHYFKQGVPAREGIEK
ncbi:MAG: cob(I)yrinic acid a,c-diamide adenosyltransferase [bacterium]|nr:cob(I)yrinic acid a,c-diamide adenosyltransferase [bacterium]MDT8365642.1 cob(I)yrinic acid a,c-diamide adenosyltransferase [bacterium]